MLDLPKYNHGWWDPNLWIAGPVLLSVCSDLSSNDEPSHVTIIAHALCVAKTNENSNWPQLFAHGRNLLD